MNKNMNKILFVFLVLLIVPLGSALGSLQTGSISPSYANLCGSYQQYATITASGIMNKENATLNNVIAKLYVTGNSGLSFITSQEVNIGTILPLSYSTVNPSWTIQCNSPIQGVYTAYVNYTSGSYIGSSIGESTSTIIVHEAIIFSGNLSIIEGTRSQQNLSYEPIADNTPTIKLTTTRDSTCKGTLDMDESYDNMDFNFYGALKEHNYTFSSAVSEGEHRLYAKCKDSIGNIASFAISFAIDTMPPVITVLSPSQNVLTEYTELKISTNEEAKCRYDDEEVIFSNMRTFDSEGKTLFSEELVNLDEDSYVYFVRCKDLLGNEVLRELSFDVAVPPQAEIVIEREFPLPKGTYEIRLYSSKSLRSIPQLSYTFTDDTSFNRNVGLIKENGYYKGFIIIEESEKTREGVFSFIGYDLSGNEGTEITKGAVFLVDTVKPIAPSMLQAQSDLKGITLKWYYDGEKPDHYNVYRSASQGVGPIHLYESVKIDSFLDKEVGSNQLYYYKIAAVDAAGNIGVLSSEVSAYSKTDGNVQAVISVNQPTKETRDWKAATEKNIDTILIDLDWAITNLKDQETKESAVEDLALVKIALSAKEDIDKLKSQLKGIDISTISDSDLRSTLQNADTLIGRTRKTVPQSLSVDKSTTVMQALTSSDIELAVSEMTKKTNYTNSQLNSYKRQMESLNKKFKSEAEIKSIAIEFLDDSTENRVIVSKSIWYDSPEAVDSVSAVEIIPKTVAGDISSIELKTPKYNILNEDPVVSWDYSTLSYDKQTILYVILTNDNSEAAKNTKTVLMISPDTLMSQGNLLTGFAAIFSKMPFTGIEFIGVIVGIIIILGLAMYYFVVINEVDLGSYVKKFQNLSPILKQEKKEPEKKKQQKEQDAPVQRKNIQNNSLSYLFKTENPLRTIPEQYFFVRNGDVVRSITELEKVVSKMDDFTFYYHVNDAKNDFAEWAITIYHNRELADIIKSASTKEELIHVMRELNK